MATDAGELLVSIKADISDLKDGLSQSTQAVEGFGSAMVAKGVLIAGAVKQMAEKIVSFGIDSLKAYAGTEEAVEQLRVALRNQGQEVDSSTEDLKAFASELQKTTRYSDDQTLETLRLLTTFGLAGEQLKKTTLAAMDLSRGLGVDLHSATLLLGKAFTGETKTLARYGIQIDENTPRALKFEEAMGQVQRRFGGAAQADIKTVNGQIAVLTNEFEDLKKIIGADLLPVFQFFVQHLHTLFSAMESLNQTASQMGGWWTTIKMAVLEASKSFVRLAGDMMPFVGLLRSLGIDVDAVFRKFDSAIDSHLGKLAQMEKKDETVQKKRVQSYSKTFFTAKDYLTKEQIEKQKTQEEEQRKLDVDVQKTIQKLQTRDQIALAMTRSFGFVQGGIIQSYLDAGQQRELADQIKRLEAAGKFDDARILKQQAYNEAVQKAEEAHSKFLADQNKRRQENFTATLNFISTLATAKNRELALIGKAASITTATMDTYTAANKALASAPPPFNYALMGAVIAAGLGNVARIAGIKMAEGGVVQAKVGGTQAIIGEAGSPEAVIPLGDQKALSMIGKAISGAGGGGGVPTIVVNVSGQFLEADSARWQRLVRDSIVPEIRRYTDVSPKGNFIRRRGQS